MKTIKDNFAQGDLMGMRVDALPDGVKERDGQQGPHILAHSETGHHHTMDAAGVRVFECDPPDPLMCYLSVATPTPVVHHRAWDTHEPIMVPPGVFKIRRQREHTPDGWRRVED